MKDIDAGAISDVAHSIGDVGALVVVTAAFILLSVAMWVAIFLWFKGIINQTIERNEKDMPALLDETRKQNELLSGLYESLRPETQIRIRNLSDLAFDHAVEKVCRLIKNIREENHIVNKEATSRKLRKRLTVIHDDRNAIFEPFTYRGKKLSEYCQDEWVEQVAQVVESEIYNDAGVNNKRAYANVKAAYDSIKNEFFHKINE